MTRPTRWDTLALLALIQLLVALTDVAITLDMTRATHAVDRNIRTGNEMLYEQEINENATELKAYANDEPILNMYDDILDANEIPVRYDEAQLWRIYNISDHTLRQSMPVAHILENKFGGTIWKENAQFLDISFDKEQLQAARGFLETNNLTREILNTNIQELIDMEQIMEVNLTESKPGVRRKKDTHSGMNWSGYHDLEVIYAFMREMRSLFPDLCRLYTIGKTAEGRDLKVLRISENPRKFKKIWIDGGIHAREWVSPATVTFILYRILTEWSTQPSYITNKTWYFMPVMNPDGYAYSHRVNRLWRKNRSRSKNSTCHGVDLNRNFDIGWTAKGSSKNPCSDTYRGTSPDSELETKAVTKFLTKRQYNMEAYLTFHSYGQVIVYPWAYKASKADNADVLQNIGNIATHRIKRKTGSIYRAAVTHEVFGIAGGGSDDWARANLKSTYVYTIELRDRGTFAFVLPPDQIVGTAIEGYTVAKTIAQAIF